MQQLSDDPVAAAPALPALPDLIARNLVDLDTLLGQVDVMLASLQRPNAFALEPEPVRQ